jgi:hypothetical protein
MASAAVRALPLDITNPQKTKGKNIRRILDITASFRVGRMKFAAANVKH